jgi:hypothetical protein
MLQQNLSRCCLFGAQQRRYTTELHFNGAFGKTKQKIISVAEASHFRTQQIPEGLRCRSIETGSGFAD